VAKKQQNSTIHDSCLSIETIKVAGDYHYIEQTWSSYIAILEVNMK